jgi:Ring finger domain
LLSFVVVETQILQQENFAQSRRSERGVAVAEETWPNDDNISEHDSQQSHHEDDDLERGGGGGGGTVASSSFMSPRSNSSSAHTQPKPPPPPEKVTNNDGTGAADDDENDDTLLIEIPYPGLSFSTAARSSGQQQQQQQHCARRMRQVSALCTICLGTFQVGSEIVWSSNSSCQHVFHEACIEKWLMIQQQRYYAHPLSCPYCRRDFLVDPCDDDMEREVIDDVYSINIDSHRHDTVNSSNDVTASDSNIDNIDTTNSTTNNANEIDSRRTFVEI